LVLLKLGKFAFWKAKLHLFFCSLIQNFGSQNQFIPLVLVDEDEKSSFHQKTHHSERESQIITLSFWF